MKETALEVLKEIEKYGYKAYIVGGFVRDSLLNKESLDVDITTNATPKDLKYIFPNSFVPNEAYGSITIIMNKTRFEITTFRRDFSYIGNRRPDRIEYINSLHDDLVRRDFTINTLCMDSNGTIIDLLNAKQDLKNCIIKTVRNAELSFTDDALRILRAIRFATVLNFKLDNNLELAIKKCKKYLKNLSFYRKKSELDKIFMSNNSDYGVSLIKKLGLALELDIYNIDSIKLSNDLVAVWASLEVSNNYPFTKAEKTLISDVKYLSKLDEYTPKILYKYGPYVVGLAAMNSNKDKNDVIINYNKLPIKSRSDILINSSEIITIFNKKAGKYISDVYKDLESEILNNNLINEKDSIIKYIKNKYILGE